MTPVTTVTLQAPALFAPSPTLMAVPAEIVVGLAYAAIGASGVVTLRTLDALRAAEGISGLRSAAVHGRHLVASAAALAASAAWMIGSVPALAISGLVYATMLAWAIAEMVRSRRLPVRQQPAERPPLWQRPPLEVLLPDDLARNRQGRIDLARVQSRAEVAPFLEQTLTTLSEEVLRADGNGAAQQMAVPTAAQTLEARRGLRAAIERHVASRRDLSPDQTSAAELAKGTLLHSMDSLSDEIAAPLFAAWGLFSALERGALRAGRELNAAERDRIAVGLTALIEGLQHCSGAWAAHMQMVVDGFRGESVSDRDWILRMLAQRRYELVAEHFRSRPQQVHFINEMRYRLWRDHQIALPGAQMSQSDWYVGDRDLRVDLRRLEAVIRDDQDPVGVVAWVRDLLNHPSHQARCISLQNQLSIHHANSEPIRAQVRPRIRQIFEGLLQVQQRRPDELLAEADLLLQQIAQEMDAVLPGGSQLLRLVKALQQPWSTDEQIDQLRINALGVQNLSERLRNALDWPNRTERQQWAQQLQRALIMEKMRAPAFNGLENRWNEQQRQQGALQAEQQFVREIAQSQHLSVQQQAQLSGLVSSLSNRLEEQEWPSLRQMMTGLSPEQAVALRQALGQAARGQLDPCRQQLEELMCRQLARREVVEEFVNEQVSVPGAIRILEMLGLLRVR